MRYRAHRYPTRFPAMIKAGVVAQKGLITSISASGASVQLEIPLAPLQRVVIEFAGGRISGQVVWCSQDRASLKFSMPLGKRELDRIRYGLNAGVSQRSHRIGFAEMR